MQNMIPMSNRFQYSVSLTFWGGVESRLVTMAVGSETDYRKACEQHHANLKKYTSEGSPLTLGIHSSVRDTYICGIINENTRH